MCNVDSNPRGELIYRIIHKDNLAYILSHGCLTCNNHTNRDPNYRSIGNNEIIEQRSGREIPIKTGRTFKDYIPFYIGPRSIMLYNITTGHNVPQIPQDQIIYIVCRISDLRGNGYDVFYTDGQGNQANTQFYNDVGNLSANVDLHAAYSRRWSAGDEAQNPDIKRRKHAEFHVYKSISINHIYKIAVLNDDVKQEVEGILREHDKTIPVVVEPTYYFFN